MYKKETLYSNKTDNDLGYYRAIRFYGSAGKVRKEEWFFTDLNQLKEQVTKIVFYYGNKGEKIKHESILTPDKAREVGYDKTVYYYDRSGRAMKFEKIKVFNEKEGSETLIGTTYLHETPKD